MQLDILGCSGTYPVPGQPASGYLVSHLNTHILCDIGFGVMGELLQRISPDRLDAVVLSHRHPDHCADFLALHHALAYGPYQRQGLSVYAAPGVADHLASFLGAGEGHVLFDIFDFHEVGERNHVVVGDIDLRFAVTEHSVPTVATRFEAGVRSVPTTTVLNATGDVRKVGSLRLLFEATDHPVETLACRLDGPDGASMVYSADTGPGGGFPGLSEGASVVMAEASIPGVRDDHQFAHHLTAAEAGEIAHAAGADLLILTHIRPDVDRVQSQRDAEQAFGGRVAIAAPGDVYQI